MKSNANTAPQVLVNQVRNLYGAEQHVQHTNGKNEAKEDTPKTEALPYYSARQPDVETNTFQRTKLNIKNMVSIRCKMLVKSVLESIGVDYTSVDLGEVEIAGVLSEKKHAELKSALFKYGLQLMDDKKALLVEKIKNIIVEMIDYDEDSLTPKKFSAYLSKKLNHRYIYLANLFSEVNGMSIQHFILTHKIRCVKKLLTHDKLTISEIAWRLHYSSTAHLSNQFRKITGLTPSQFRNMKHDASFTPYNVKP